MPEVLKSAIEVGEVGFALLPVHCIINGACSCGDKNCTKQGKHPKRNNWKYTATSDPKKLSTLFAANDCNLGIATGYKSKLIVIDIDPKNGGDDSCLKLFKEHGALDEHTLVANTGGDGQHIYFRYGGNQIGNYHGTVFGAGIDIKGNGGYVIGAPSNHISGGDYYWRNGFYLPAELPTDLEQILLDYKGTQTSSKRFEQKDIVTGNRNISLAGIAGRYRAKGLEVDQLESKLLKDNQQRCKPPLPEREVKAIAQSICRYERGNSKASFKDYWLACIFNEHSGLDHGTKGVLGAMYHLMDDSGGNCIAPQTLIAIKSGCSRPTVSNLLNKAHKLGWLTIYRIPKTNGTQGIFNSYIANVGGLMNN
jgi:putative DNA primase/helicase